LSPRSHENATTEIAIKPQEGNFDLDYTPPASFTA
jgi:hypothetical protein